MPRTSQELKICSIIESRATALLDDLRLHVGIPTGLNNTAGLDETRERFASRMAALGATVDLIQGDPKPDWLVEGAPAGPIPPTAVCRRTNGRLGPKVLIAGHLDTVHDPKSDFRALTISPEGNTGVGPGCVDMKGGLVIAAHALEALEEAGLACAWSFLMNSDEETGSFHSAKALAGEAALHDVGLALEPALPAGALAIERMGSGQFMIECRGRSAHVGREFTKGVSAVTRLAECLVRIAHMPDPGRGLILNVGPLEGGKVSNAVPDRARAWGNVRYPTPEAGSEIAAMLHELDTDADAMPYVQVRHVLNRPAKPLVEATGRLAQLTQDVASDLGQPLSFARTGGVCDGNNLQHAGLPTVDTLGVRGGGLHTRDEWIDLTSLVDRCQLLAILVHRIASGAWMSAQRSDE